MKQTKRFLLKVIISLMLIVSIFLGGMLYLGYNSYKKLNAEAPVSLMYEDIKENHDSYVEIENISNHMKNAIVAVEDHRFYKNKGIDYIALARSLYSTIINKNAQGASTITMQLTKNYYYDYHPNLIRKFAEVFFAYEIDTTYEKEKILEMYLNIIYYGDGYDGIYDASLGYFEKEPIDLNIDEASMLAGIINAPSRYNLSTGELLALQRQKTVLRRMKKHGYIDQTEYDYYMTFNSIKVKELVNQE